MELSTTLKKEGFGLEVKVCNILGVKFSYERNPAVAQGDVDIIAHSYHCNSILIIQVKGSAPDKILSLYCNTAETIRRKPLGIAGSVDTYFNAPLLQYQKQDDTETGGFIYLEPNSKCENIVMVTNEKYKVAMRHAYSGDFRHASAPHKKAPRQDNKNNLYKGLKQVVEGGSSLQETIDTVVLNSLQRAMKVFPIIVTNTKIFIKEDDEANEIEVKWALYQHKSISSMVEYIFIVNIDSLGEFLGIFVY